VAIKRIATAVLLAAVSIMVLTAVKDDDASFRSTSAEADELTITLRPDPVATAMAYVQIVQDQVGTYIIHAAYDEAVQQLAVTDEFLASLYVPPPSPPAPATQAQASGGYSGGTTVGECTGFAIPDYIIQRESGGNPSAMNPSGAYGCAQTLLSHYSGGSCAGLDPYSIDGQRQCVNILSNGGTNLAPWAETR
jgi:hypothetical protein